MRKRLARFLSVQSSRPRPVFFRILALSGGILVFLILVPLLLAIIGRFVAAFMPMLISRSIEVAAGIIFVCFGLCLLAWAVFAFWRFGGGTPAPVAAPQKLVVRGPYRYCRNPTPAWSCF